jgi:hypothetical protein
MACRKDFGRLTAPFQQGLAPHKAKAARHSPGVRANVLIDLANWLLSIPLRKSAGKRFRPPEIRLVD